MEKNNDIDHTGPSLFIDKDDNVWMLLTPISDEERAAFKADLERKFFTSSAESDE